MTDIEVHIDFSPGPKRVGTIHRHARRGGETISFEYHPAWLEDAARFSLEPALALDRGAFVPANGVPVVSVRAAPIDGGKHRFYSAPELRCRLISGSTSSVVVPEVMNKSSAASSLCMSW